jgi:hypothetical protein
MPSIKLPHTLTGIAGEYFVAAELSRRGFMASITLRNNDSVDIHASRLSDNKIYAIQVKTNQAGRHDWMLSKKAESNKKENFFYIFVALKGVTERPEFFIVPSQKVAEFATNSHAHWLSVPGRNGQKHNDSSMRKFFDIKGEYLERWDLLS